MSQLGSWSYTAAATIWRVTGRDDKTGKNVYASPEVIACDYQAKAERRTDDKGVEFVSRMSVYTEYATAKQGDYILIGSESVADPVAAGAALVRSVVRYADTFYRVADDYEIIA